eukprot:NODE_3275_length_1248_cov_111.392000_g3110_i0.p1 GENE.NODE_3275_length_1248_cov_111.392000_g3110_i0~~NODE_3275_length_1248_cov_111.392000_g3110_i0.p1  ORF type:complete len:337 (-),score=40.05 NODE_3275_length_1248_cov_111.392000_g3110_i0:161-1171(-)
MSRKTRSGCAGLLHKIPASEYVADVAWPWLKATACFLLGRGPTVGDRRLALLQKIGEGGFATVYLCQDESGSRFALKHSHIDGAHQRLAAKTEVRMLRSIKHANIVALVDSEAKDASSEVLLLTEYVGPSVLHIMQEKVAQRLRFPDNEILAIVRDITAALCFLHGQTPPIAHRDVKLDNVLFCAAEQRYKLCDFGSAVTHAFQPSGAAAINAQQEDIDRSTTLAYRAPEQLDLYGGVRVDQKVDIWALGCCVYYLCFHELPFGEQRLVILGGHYKIPQHNRQQGLVDLIGVCLELNPAVRPDAWRVMESICGLLGVANDVLCPATPPVQPLVAVP